MELLLNILWLLLALPAFWVWRREFVSGRQRFGVRAASSIVLLGCVLLLLFPVVSATDDMHAMRAEMEESSPGKRMVKLAAPNSQASLTAFWAMPPRPLDLPAKDETIQGHVLPGIIPCPLDVMLRADAGRAPPIFV